MNFSRINHSNTRINPTVDNVGVSRISLFDRCLSFTAFPNYIHRVFSLFTRFRLDLMFLLFTGLQLCCWRVILLCETQVEHLALLSVTFSSGMHIYYSEKGTKCLL